MPPTRIRQPYEIHIRHLGENQWTAWIWILFSTVYKFMKSEHLSPQTADTNTVQPMEDEVVTISHAKGSFTFPTNFQLIDAINPYPCG